MTHSEYRETLRQALSTPQETDREIPGLPADPIDLRAHMLYTEAQMPGAATTTDTSKAHGRRAATHILNLDR